MTKKDEERERKQRRWEHTKHLYRDDPDFVWLLGEMQEFDLIQEELGPDGWLRMCMLAWSEYYRRKGFVYEKLKREWLEMSASSMKFFQDLLDRGPRRPPGRGAGGGR